MEKKSCFIITPIGDDNSAIRRHIDGIIDQAILPAIGELFEIKVAHRQYEIGSINERIIQNIFDSDLVIANLTGLNPNVMFEIAIRYSFGKPAVVIAEKGTKLPFDIVEENTIFYINDPAGAAELRDTIKKFVDKLDWNRNTYGPVYKAISNAATFEEIKTSIEGGGYEAAFSFLVKKISDLEAEIKEKCLQDSYIDENKNDFYKLEEEIDRERITFRRRWSEIKKEVPFNVESAYLILKNIDDFVNSILERKSWTVQERRYIKGKLAFLEQEIRNYIYNEKNNSKQ